MKCQKVRQMARQFKLARQFKNLKTVEAAELLGVSQPTLSAWETGRKSPSVDSLEKMADLYGCARPARTKRACRSRPPPRKRQRPAEARKAGSAPAPESLP